MTYEEIVMRVRQIYEDADARMIFEHVAVQINITGKVEGAFYVEIANRNICVEPYDYYDRDGLITADADVIIAIADGKIALQEAYDKGLVSIEGNMQKLKLLQKIKRARPEK